MLIIDRGNDYAVSEAMPLGLSQSRQIKKTCMIKFDIIRRIPSPQVGTSQPKKLETELQHVPSVVFHDLTGISPEWAGLESLIKVERIGTRAGKPYHQVAYYISSLVLGQLILPSWIRGHWGIENRLHWGGSAVGGFPDLRRLPFKDVIFDEDHSTIRMGNAPANLSVMRT